MIELMPIDYFLVIGTMFTGVLTIIVLGRYQDKKGESE